MNSIKTTQAIFILCSLAAMNVRGAYEQKVSRASAGAGAGTDISTGAGVAAGTGAGAGVGAGVTVGSTVLQVPSKKRKRTALSPEQAYLDKIVEICQEAKEKLMHYIQPGDIAVFDVDNTALATYAMENWRSTTEVLPLPPVLDLYHFLLSVGVTPVFITSRSQENKEGNAIDDPTMVLTKQQLANAGYSGYFELYIKPSRNDNSAQYKYEAREDAAEKGRILLNIGDSDYDFENDLGDPEQNESATAILDVNLPRPKTRELNKDTLRELIKTQLKSKEAAITHPPHALLPTPGIISTEPPPSSSSSSSPLSIPVPIATLPSAPAPMPTSTTASAAIPVPTPIATPISTPTPDL